MGNCQTTDVAAVVIQHPDGTKQKASCPLSASRIMAANPGHYVAVVITVVAQRRSCSAPSAAVTADELCGKAVRYLKLLAPDEPLQVDHFYRLVSFEDVLREFGTKRQVRLSKLVATKNEIIKRPCDGESNVAASSSSVVDGEEGTQGLGFQCSGGEICFRSTKQGQWKPNLQTISETAKF
ncbi:uncharacterized protein LOC122026111 [Zingiber officinale]|uniref:uncharacterized protein LOC122026111 n=1 Tax=Zingiber officinale TaxID=94328 RepID=UPI001C4AF576|nr:uncharacterized protein LOC122026111 [Zingiber officinale]